MGSARSLWLSQEPATGTVVQINPDPNTVFILGGVTSFLVSSSFPTKLSYVYLTSHNAWNIRIVFFGLTTLKIFIGK
jgi:hypothetical protein